MLPDLFNQLCTLLPTTLNQAFPSLLLAVGIATFLGSFAHCTFMCGPLVTIQVSKRLESVSIENISELTRLKGAALMPYHLGRITTYTFLGALAGLAGQWGSTLWQNVLPYALLVGGISIILSSLSFFKKNNLLTTLLSKNPIFSMIRFLFAYPLGIRGYGLGVFLGFLPCGMVLAALVTAGATGGTWRGAILMLTFGISTIPALFLVGLLGSLAMTNLKKRFYFISKVVTIFAGGWLCLIALNLLLA